MEDIPLNYNPGLILNELERRFYLYLVGGEYEQLFYSFVGCDNTDEGGVDGKELVRVKLDVEVSRGERRNQFTKQFADPSYKSMLDRILDFHIKKRIDHPEELNQSFFELVELMSLFSRIEYDSEFSQTHLDYISGSDWLSAKVTAFLAQESFQTAFNFKPSASIVENLKVIGPRLFVWLVQRWFGDLLLKLIHPSLINTYRRARFYSRVISGAIIMLGKETSIDIKKLWRMYIWGAANAIPVCVLLLTITNEINLLVADQRANLTKAQNNQVGNEVDVRHQVLDEFKMAEDALFELLKLDEVLKPIILETLNVDSLKDFVLLAADPTSLEGDIFRRARAYAYYRQLYRSGRIKKHEIKVLLSGFNVSVQDVVKLNESKLASFDSHLNVYRELYWSK